MTAKGPERGRRNSALGDHHVTRRLARNHLGAAVAMFQAGGQSAASVGSWKAIIPAHGNTYNMRALVSAFSR